MNAVTQMKHADPFWTKQGLCPGLVLRAFGMRRAGNHAIINWLQRNAPTTSTLFLNNCVAGRDPMRSTKGIEVNGTRLGKLQDNDLQDALALVEPGALAVISYEDAMPGQKRAKPISNGLDESTIDHELILYRGFLNWAASLVRKLSPNPAYSAAKRVEIVLKAIDLYAHSLKLVIDQRALGLTAICYDSWLVDATYRQEILAALGLPVRDNDLGDVQPYGGGSSFQGTDLAAQDLQTLSRWEAMQDDPEYRIVLYLAAQDKTFMDRLTAVFPKDAAQLRDLADPAQLSRIIDKSGDHS